MRHPSPGLVAGVVVATGLVFADPDFANATICAGPGCSATHPAVVTPNGSGNFVFSSPTSGLWYDPPLVAGFIYDIVGATFSSLTTPPSSFGFGAVELFLGSIDEGPIATGGNSSTINGATEFELLGITPLLDESASNFASSYPVQLSFNGSPTILTITPVIAAPEPVSVSLFGMALAGLGSVRRSRSRS